MRNLQHTLPIFVLISLTVGDNVLNNMIQEMHKVERNTCSVASFEERNLICNVPVENGYIPNHGTCDLLRSDDTKKTIYCFNGYLHISTTQHRGRVKREKSKDDIHESVAIGAGVGAALGPIGALLGSAIGFFACLIFCPEEPDVITNKPPSITCGIPQPSDNIIAEPLATNATVTWDEPLYSDPEGDSVSIKDVETPPNSSFVHGRHVISYTATDINGNSAVCSFQFQVTINYCRESLYVTNGYADCDPADKIYGSVCTIYCNDGYQLTSDSISTKTCEGTSFSSGKTECERKKCAPPTHLCNGNYTCTNYLYELDTVCYPKCNTGYKTEMNQYLKCNGDSWEGTNATLICEDAEPPEFVICPSSIIRYADRGSDEATNVTWTEPIITDNAQEGESCADQSKPVLKQVKGLEPGSNFSEGFHLIKYEATDGNELAAFCSFNVIIETISCDPLMPSDKYLMSQCPTGYTYGSTCYFSCFLSYSLKGNESVSCELDKSGKHGIWAWANDTESYCERLMCPELPAPANGALACSIVIENQFCTMSCNEKYQTPLKPPIQFSCNEEQEWTSIPPNCTERRNPNLSVMPGELIYFFSGDCSDTSVQQGIKDNFITVMEDLAFNRNWSNICPTFCNISDVAVTCGIETGRKRREIGETHLKRRFKRSKNEVTLTFSLLMGWIEGGGYWSNDYEIIAVSERVKNISANGEFDYNGISPVNMAFSYSKIGCEEGSVPDYFSNACSGCAPGTYLFKTTEECKDCAKGYYQDEEYQSTCKQCPTGMSTEDAGSSSLADCKEICPPGTYSYTGVVPCSVCAIGEYQPLEESTNCLTCAKGKFTETLGATNVADCKNFDVVIPADTQISFKSVTISSNDFALSFWVFCPDYCTSFIILKIKDFTFDVGNNLTVSHYGTNVIQSVDEFKFKTWIKVLFAWTHSNNELNVHVNENIVLTKSFFSGINGSLTATEQLQMSSTQKMYVSGLVLHTTFASDIYTMTCTPLTTDAIYTMSDFLTIDNSDIELLESQCDEINECTSNPCGVDNICYNKINGYNCTCLDGYRGSNCQTPPDFCLGNNCVNEATCESQQENYTCQCASGYKGPFCENEIVNGGWSYWTGWSECSKTCNGGIRSRVRFCDSPPPEPDGRFCVGSDNDGGNCNMESCPVCKPYYEIKQFKNKFNCTTINDHISCTVTCQNGYVFLPEFEPLDQYECGNNTNYQWYDTPPVCAPINFPINLRTRYTIRYENSGCTNADEIKEEMTARVQSLQCVDSSTCQVSVETNGCDSSGIDRRRRSTQDLEVIVTFISTLTDSNALDMEAFYTSQIVSPELDDLIKKYIDQVITAQQMVNNTDFYTIDVNGDVYATNLSSISLRSTVSCSPGKVEHQAVCVACPAGTHWSDGSCVLCPIGTYQNETGQLKCEDCLNGYTTLYRACKNVTDCFEDIRPTSSTAASLVSELSGDTEEDMTKVIIPVITVILLAATIIVTLVALLKYRKYIRRLNRHKQHEPARSRSLASLNMIEPVFQVQPNDYGVPPTSAFTPR